MTIIGTPATGTHARCLDCGYGTVPNTPDATGIAVIVHAASCPGIAATHNYVACDNPDCRKVLDPARVAKHGARTCNDRCRAAAWKTRHNYGRHDPPTGHANDYNGCVCTGCGADVSQSGKVHTDDCPVVAAQLAQAHAIQDASKPRRRRASGLQLSYLKTVDVLARHLLGAAAPVDDGLEARVVWAQARSMASEILRPALSDKQRERLEARERNPT